VRVQPRAKRNTLKFRPPDEWKLLLTAPPVDGAANEACIDFFARGLRIPRSRVQLLVGKLSRQKVIALDGVSLDQLIRLAAGEK